MGLTMARQQEMKAIYKVFISYKHQVSRRFAEALENALKTYAKPLLRPPIRIFRDEKILRAGDDLPKVIVDALRDSEFFILIASPAAAESPWVLDELTRWCGEHGRVDRLVIVLTEGDIAVDGERKCIIWDRTTALPQHLSKYVTGLPLFVDLTGTTEKDWTLDSLRFKDAVNSIAAKLRGLTPEQMNDEHVLQHRRNLRMRNGAVTIIGILLIVSLIASFLLWQSKRDLAATNIELKQSLEEVTRQRNTSESRRIAALSTIERSSGRWETATILAAEAYNVADTVDARSSLLASLQQWAGKEAIFRSSQGQISSLALRKTKEVLPRELLAIGTETGYVLLRDLREPGNFVQTGPALHRAAVNNLAFNEDATLLASAGVGADRQLLLWKVNDGLSDEPLSFLDGFPGYGWSAAFSPDGKYLATARGDGSIILGDIAGTRVSFNHLLWGHRDFVFSLTFDPGGSLLASGGRDKAVVIWDVQKRAVLGEPLVGHSDVVSSVAFSPDGQLLASGSHDKTIILWDVATRKPVGRRLVGHRDLVSSLAFSPDGKLLASGSADRTVIVWDVAARKPIGLPLRAHLDTVSGVAFSSDGTLLASGGRDGAVILWRLGGRGPLARTLAERIKGAGALDYSPDGRLVVVGDSKGWIHFFDPEKSNSVVGKPISTGTEMLQALTFSPDGKRLASASYDGTVRLWNVQTRAPMGPPRNEHSESVSALAFSPDGALLASGSDDRTVILRDGIQGVPIGDPLDEHFGKVKSLAFSPNGKFLASGSEDHTIIVWDVKRHAAVGKPLQGHVESVTSLAFDRSGALVSGSYDGSIRLWDVVKGQPIGGAMRATRDGVQAIALTPDGRTLATATTEGEIGLWDLIERRVIGEPLRSHRAWVMGLRFSPDGHRLASVGEEGNLVLWSIAAQDWRALARSLAHRNLSLEEWRLFMGQDASYRKTFPDLP